MQKAILFIFTSLVIISNLSAEPIKTDVALSQGYRREKLKYKIKRPGNNSCSNLMGVLEFKKMNIYTTQLACTLTKQDYFLQAIGSYGLIYGGKAEDYDSSFFIARSFYNSVDYDIKGNYTAEGALRIGKNIRFENGFNLSPRIGYSAYMQRLRLSDPERTVVNYRTRPQTCHKMKLSHLHSHFRAHWYAPELGVQLSQTIVNNVQLFGGYTFLYPIKSTAKGATTLKQRQRNYTITNKATKSFGNIINIGLKWLFSTNWTAGIEYEYTKLYSKGGHDHRGRFSWPMKNATLTSYEGRVSLAYTF